MNINESEVEKIKADLNSIRLDTHQFILVKHPSLKNIVCILWTHDTHNLVLLKTDNPELLAKHFKVDLKIAHNLILNAEHPGHERVFSLSVNEKTSKLILSNIYSPPGYSLNLTIIDDQ